MPIPDRLDGFTDQMRKVMQHTKHLVPWARLAGITALWLLVVGSTSAFYILYRDADGRVGGVPIAGTGIAGTDWEARTVGSLDCGFARSYAHAMIIPGPQNGGHPWSEEQVHGYLEPCTQGFWPDMWEHLRTPLAVAAAGLIISWIVIVLRARPLPIRERRMSA